MRSLLQKRGVPTTAAARLSAELASRYDEPHRRYHTGEHIAEVLAEVDRLLPSAGLSADDEDAVRFAAWFHDAVYDPTAVGAANEGASAALAIACLVRAGVAEALSVEVGRLVLLTAGHRAEADDVSGAVLVAADLAILAAPPDRYDRYARDVRAEYVAVDDARWRDGRADVLRRFLDAATIYPIGPDRLKRDQAAKANLARELATLTGPGSARPGAPVGGASRPLEGGAQAPAD